MKGFVANTDYDWYSYLKERQNSSDPLEEVNFWQPSARGAFQAIPRGLPFFFKLKKPHYAIAGFGYFSYFSALPAWLAWDTFGGANGAGDFLTMNQRIAKYRREAHPDPAGRYEIGCIMLIEPAFFEPGAWVEQPRDWKPNVVRGAGYDLESGEGQRIWNECRARVGSHTSPPAGAKVGDEPRPPDGPRYGTPTLVQPRLGQGSFRIAVTDAYQRACAVTQEHSLPALEAAHIRPYGEEGPHSLQNGVLLRSDIHRLFDRGYVTITPDHRFEVSSRLKTEYDNGHSYYRFHGSQVHVPKASDRKPADEFLVWHNENLYRG